MPNAVAPLGRARHHKSIPRRGAFVISAPAAKRDVWVFLALGWIRAVLEKQASQGLGVAGGQAAHARNSLEVRLGEPTAISRACTRSENSF